MYNNISSLILRIYVDDGVTNLYRLIVNADDFGRHLLINAAVEQALTRGCLRSATLMPGGVAFDDAISIASRHPELGLGVHFTLVNGNPVLPPAEIPSLVTAEGTFYPDHNSFLKQYLQGKVRLAEVRKELAAQLHKVTATGVRVTHVDSHQHLHTLPGIIDIVLELAAAAGIKAVRIPKATLFPKDGGASGLGALIGRVGLYSLARLAQGKAAAKGFKVPDHFAGIVAGDAVDCACMLAVIKNLQPGTTEVMIHPGTDNGILQKECGWEHDFEAELAALTDSRVLQALQERRVVCSNYSDLQA